MNNKYPCLWFNGNAKEAAEFYCSVFKNSSVKTTTPMVVIFELAGKQFMGLNGGPMFTFNPSISFFVKCGSLEETNDTWKKLEEGGKALMPIDKYPWSERYGWIQDKFGLTWQLMVHDKENDGQSITPSMLFTGDNFGKAEEAIQRYSTIFENSSITRIEHYPEEDANAGKVMYSEFKLGDYDIIAMDGHGDHKYSFNEAVSLVVNCNTQEEIDFFWNSLTADGGKESMCGWLKDKFGVSWQIVPAVLGKLMTDPAKAPKVMEAFMKMKKFIIADLENAAG